MMKPRDIARIRKELGLSRPALGRALQTSESIVWRWENGVHRPSRAMQQLMEILLERHRAAVLAAMSVPAQTPATEESA